MIVLTFPWHWVGILGMPRRMAFYDYTNPEIAAEAVPVIMSVIGGAILVVSGALFFLVLLRGQFGAACRAGDLPVQCRGAAAAHGAGRAQRVGALAWPDDRADHRQLRLPDRARHRDTRHGGAGDHGRGTRDERGARRLAEQSLVHRQRRDHGSDRPRRVSGRLLVASARAARRAVSAVFGTRYAAPRASCTSHHRASRSSPPIIRRQASK